MDYLIWSIMLLLGFLLGSIVTTGINHNKYEVTECLSNMEWCEKQKPQLYEYLNEHNVKIVDGE